MYVFWNCVWINISLVCLFDSFSNTIIGPSLRDVFTFVRIEDSAVSNLNHVLGIACLSLKVCLIQFWVLHSLVSMISSYMDPSSDSRSLT